MKCVLIAALFALSLQDDKSSVKTLEQTIRDLHDKMRSGDKETQRKALKGILPAKEDLDVLFPRHAEKLWIKMEEGLKEHEERVEDVAKEFIRGGAIKEIELRDIRGKEKIGSYQAVLELIPQNVPGYVIRYESRTAAGGTYLFVNDRWIFFRGLSGVPKVIERLP